MVAIGMGLVFAGYAVGIWGYCLVAGYDVPFAAVFGSRWPGASTAKANPGTAAKTSKTAKTPAQAL